MSGEVQKICFWIENHQKLSEIGENPSPTSQITIEFPIGLPKAKITPKLFRGRQKNQDFSKMRSKIENRLHEILEDYYVIDFT